MSDVAPEARPPVRSEDVRSVGASRANPPTTPRSSDPSDDRPPRRWAWLARLWALSTGRFGLIVVGVIVLTAIVAAFWTPFPPQQVDIADRWAGPGWPHLLGTDGSGRDILSLLMAGARTTMFVAIGAGIVATVVGVALAALGALTARWIRESVAVLVDILIAFPVLIIAMMISAVFGGSLWVVIWSVGIGFGVNIARVTRPELRRVLHSDFVLAGRASGLTPAQNLWRHLMPNVAPVFIVQLSWGMAVAVLAEAGLSYLGLGAPPTEPSWGLLLAQLQQYITVHPLSVIWPGLAITLTVLGLNLLGDGLREATDPTLTRASRARRAAESHVPEVVS
ncbi:MAG: ABC transporter permease [Microbacterium sp.]